MKKQGQYESAIFTYESALKIDPTAAGVYYNLAKAYKDSGNHESAKKNFHAASLLNSSKKESDLELDALIKKELTHI